MLLWAVPCWVLLYGGQHWPLPVTPAGTALFVLGLVCMPLAMVRGHGRRQQDRAAIIGDTRLDQPALAVLAHHGTRTLLCTSRGTGFWGPPFRVFAPGEITLLTLRSPHRPTAPWTGRPSSHAVERRDDHAVAAGIPASGPVLDVTRSA